MTIGHPEPHALLASDPIEQELIDRTTTEREAVFAAQDELQRVVARRMSFEGRPYPVSIRPVVLERDQAAHLRTVSEELVAALDTVAMLYRDRPDARALFPAYDRVREFAAVMPPLTPAATIARLDGVLDDDGRLQVLETNAACPGGVIQSGMAVRDWEGAPGRVGARWRTDPSFQPILAQPDCFVVALLDAHASIHGCWPATAAVANFEGRYQNEVDRIVSTFRRLGVAAEQLDAGTLSWNGRQLLSPGGRALDLVYNKLDPLDLLDRPELAGYLEAATRGRLTFLSALVAQWVLEDKAALAVLTDPRFAGYFTARQRDLIARHVPWTRLCDDGPTTAPDGARCDLVEYVASHREELVLKPTNASRGDGVVVGGTVQQTEWESVLSAAVRSRRYVAQSYVRARRVLVPDRESLSLQWMCSGIDMYVFAGRFAGFHARASSDPVINIGRRGVLLPVVVRQAAPAGSHS